MEDTDACICAKPELAVVIELRDVSAVVKKLGIIGPPGPSQALTTLDKLSPAQQDSLNEQALPLQHRRQANTTCMAHAKERQTCFLAQGPCY